MTLLASVEFTDRDIWHITAVLPAECDPRRRELLSKVLREWALHDLQEHLERESPATKRKYRSRQTLLSRIGKKADSLLAMLDKLDEGARVALAAQIGIATGQSPLDAIYSSANEERLGQARDFVALIAAGGKHHLQEPRRGQPRNTLAYLVMTDLAAIYEWVTGVEASRQVSRKTHEETGQFHDFAGSMWPIIFKSVDDGLAAALKNWAEARKKYGEPSPLIFNIALRHPKWGLLASE
jgi:hypothetical protein